ncbi:MAG: NADH-quinone oxidoreductase subunit [Actinomycetota bacterium]|nr:NADH-quinone oxidoreductase subunit [Actinomycetota bacterium]MEA2487408.1 NADH-quinone oxidoreductase subunit [Actinomycetota bacterium]
MSIDWVVFGVMFVMALGASIAMLFAPNAVHVALFLVGAQIALAIAFLLEGAFFLAVVQIIVYAGAIMVLFLFVIMLLGVDKREALVEPLKGQRQVAIALGTILAGEIIYVAVKGISLTVSDSADPGALIANNQNPGNVTSIARSLFSGYLLPFEVTSVLLVVAVVGVMVLARRMGAISSPTRETRDSEEVAA